MRWRHKITRFPDAAPRHAVTFKRATPPVRARSGSVGPLSETQVQAWRVRLLTSRELSSARETASQGSVSSLLRMTPGQRAGPVAVDKTGKFTRSQWPRPPSVPGCAPAPFTNHRHIGKPRSCCDNMSGKALQVALQCPSEKDSIVAFCLLKDSLPWLQSNTNRASKVLLRSPLSMRCTARGHKV